LAPVAAELTRKKQMNLIIVATAAAVIVICNKADFLNKDYVSLAKMFSSSNQ
jgi:hypothetical protein